MAKSQPILPSKVQRAEFGRSIYVATLEEGVTVADLTKSDFWVHNAGNLNPLDRIEAVTADGETYVELLVGRVEKINDGNRTVRIPKLFKLQEVHLGGESAAAKASAKAAADAPGFVAPQEDENLRNQQTNRVAGDPAPTASTAPVVAPGNEAARNAPTNAAPGAGFDDEDGDGVPDGYQVKYGGPTHKYRVLQDGVTEPLASGMSKKDAKAWAVEHAAKSA